MMGFKFILSFILFFLCLIFPIEPIFRIPKYIIMILLTLYCKNIGFFKQKSFFYFVVLIIFFSVYGLINSTGDLKNNIQVYLIMPFLYSWVIILKDPKVQSIFTFNVLLSVLVTLILMWIFQLFEINHFQLNYWDPPNTGTSARYSFNSLTKEFSFPLFNILPFTLCFLIVYFGKNMRYKIFLFIVALLISYYSGRRGVVIGVALTGLLILLNNLNIYLKSGVFLFFLIVISYILLINYLIYDLDDHRYYQLISLVNMWQENIFFGHGLGAHTDFIRNVQKPSSYELFYFSLLNQIGIIGLLYLVIYFKKFILFKTQNLFTKSVQFGIIAVLFSSFTNPYFDRFDFLFIIFIPLILMNEKK
jgi:hypothetical protein